MEQKWASYLLKISILLWIWWFKCFSIFHHCMRKSIHLDRNIIHFMHMMKPLQKFGNIHFWCWHTLLRGFFWTHSHFGENQKNLLWKLFWFSKRSIFFHLVWIELIWEWQTGNPLERTTSTKPLRNNVYAFPTHTKWDFPPEWCKFSRKDSLSLFLAFCPCFLENKALK